MEIKLPVNSNAGKERMEGMEGIRNTISREEKSRAESAITRDRFMERQSGQQSPSSLRFAKTSSKVLDQPLSHLQQINSTQTQITQLIEDLDTKLQSNYHIKQTALMQAYRQQLIQGHKQLTDLKNNNNQQQIKNQMNEKFLQLKKQRLQLIQTNMFYSNKCQEYKQILDTKLNQGHQLEREIQFLQKQIDNSNNKKIQLMSQIYQNNSPLKLNPKNYSQIDTHRVVSLENIHFQDQNLKIGNNSQYQDHTPNKKISLSTHANTQIIKKMGLTSNSKSKIKIPSNKIPEINSQAKKIFNQKLADENFYTDRSGSKSGTILTKISLLQNQNSEFKKQSQKQPSQIQLLFTKTVNEVKEKKGSKKQIPLFKGQQFTDMEKKEIMKTFLSKEEVKQYIYNIIFDKTEDTAVFRKKAMKEKFKIVASDKKETTAQ